ncbi:MAG: hypothetical protein JSV05_05200 [Candidatus Bathyarchaeota archaeon]|nr:MAG: hypothetical protein JSV05_05200 [Candidatus Bathyarchaeota archaeon]
MHYIEKIIYSISKEVNFIQGAQSSNQYIDPISDVLTREGFYVIPEYEFRMGNQQKRIDIYAKKRGTIIGIDIDKKTVRENSINKMEYMKRAIPVFILTYEGYPNIQESVRRIPFRPFYLIDLYNHRYYYYQYF